MEKGRGGKMKGKPGETAVDVEVIPMPPPKWRAPKGPTKEEAHGGVSGPRPVDLAPGPKKDPTGTM